MIRFKELFDVSEDDDDSSFDAPSIEDPYFSHFYLTRSSVENSKIDGCNLVEGVEPIKKAIRTHVANPNEKRNLLEVANVQEYTNLVEASVDPQDDAIDSNAHACKGANSDGVTLVVPEDAVENKVVGGMNVDTNEAIDGTGMKIGIDD